MPLNKIHDILDDAVSKPYVDKAHLTRIGLMLNTVDKSKPIPMTEDDRVKMLALPTIDDVLSMHNARDIGLFVLQFAALAGNGLSGVIHKHGESL